MQNATQSAAIQAAQHFTGQFQPLEQVTRPNLTTAETAFYLNRKPQTLRAWACLENGPIRPRRVGGLLAWNTSEVKALAGVTNNQKGFSTLAYLAYIIGAALLCLMVSTGAFASLDWAGVAMLGAGVIGTGSNSQTQDNLLRLAILSRDDKKQFRACCELAKKLNLQSPKRKAAPPTAAATRLQNFVRGIRPQDLQNSIAKFGATAVHNKVNTDSILETAARKFSEQAILKACK